MPVPSHPTRRALLFGTAGAAVLLAGGPRTLLGTGAAAPRPALPVADTAVLLDAAPVTVDLGSQTVTTWGYGDRVPGPEIRVTAGGTVSARLRNNLPQDTTVHWHGVRVASAMDGAPWLSQVPVAPGGVFDYHFTAPDPGTYFYHSHVGTQLDRGAYGALVVEDPDEPLGYDAEWTVILDDWLDGIGTDPDEALERVRDPGPNPMHSTLLGGIAGHIAYPHYLVNGRTPQAPEEFTAAPGRRIRLRLINAGADTAFRVALGGHELTVTHTDGYPVVPVTVDTVLIAMGERYDVLVTLGDGVFPLVAAAEGKGARAFAVVRTSAGEAPPASVDVAELHGRLPRLSDLIADPSVDLGNAPARGVDLVLSHGTKGTVWTLGSAGDFDTPLRVPVAVGERVRLSFTNTTRMWHPIHLHGHTFQVQRAAGRGPRKDTVVVRPRESVTVDVLAENPGEWMLHCHNLYHSELGMMATLGYGDTPPTGPDMPGMSGPR
ncbi:multicopper oxidase family protein [Embleya scabrispora]|uniref:multicopper oxidase family protein n=1 Tax=Embleya scabrispora TaxID=159449 RepID=UPI000378A183|nr:multicopper oxidase family protein [Embleya scabrispora]MYS80887.1 multicopper oxidase domain-containing protein [Streptomyces sp. SID5474]